MVQSNQKGQTESKKQAKRDGGAIAGQTTKGTAMSFGYKKKNNNNIAKNGILKNYSSGEKGKGADNKKNVGHITQSLLDTNGNSGSLDSLNEEFTLANALKSGHEDATNCGRTTPRLVAPKKEIAGHTFRSNRFGFRQTNIVRPASTGLQPKVADFDQGPPTDPNNNKVKPRSKSAVNPANIYDDNNNTPKNYNHQISGSKGSSPKHQQRAADKQNQLIAARVKGNDQMVNHPTYPKIAPPLLDSNSNNNRLSQQSNGAGGAVQKTTINIKLQSHTVDTKAGNVRPTSINNTSSVSAVAAATQSSSDESASSSSSSVSKFTLHTASLPRPQYPVPISVPARYSMDSKSAKQALNNSRREFLGNMGSSNDSGYVPYQSPRKARLRQRNLEVVMSGRHKFEIRDLEDSLSDESVVPLALPKLPSAFQQSSSASQIPLTGLVRVSQVDARLNAQAPHQLENNPGIGSVSYRQPILNESIEEEKLHIDNSTSEKMQKRSSTQSKNSSPSSSRASWCNAGESMAHKAECSSISSNEIDNKFARSTMICSTVETEEDFSSITFTNDYQISSETMPTLTLSRTVGMSIEPEELEKDHVHEIDNINKFCDLADKVGDALLDDETSPTNSMMSSYTDSDGKKKLNGHVPSGGDKIVEEANEKSKSPPTPGTPSHTNSNSMSLSDPGRDFLIDDEIADQPELVSNYKNESISMEHQNTDNTPTVVESATHNHQHLKLSQQKPLMGSPVLNHLSPALRLRKMARSESLDTLSPCESIASDDLMMDFESQSSLDSIDRINRSQHNVGGPTNGGASAVHSMDETQLWSELEQQGGQLFREWNDLLKITPIQKPTSRDCITSQLPARATRLLNRSRIQSTLSNGGSDSPRSMDGIPRRSSSLNKASPSKISSEDLVMDQSVRNNMIQDILYFKKQLLRLRRLLQEDEDDLKRTDTLNPFETSNGPISSSCALQQQFPVPVSSDEDQNESCGGGDETQLPSVGSLLSLQSLTPSLTDDPKQELADLRRQVVFLQSQIDDKDRTIRIQKNLIAKYETERQQQQMAQNGTLGEVQNGTKADLINAATQTDRLRPLSQVSQDGLSRTEQNGKSPTSLSSQRHNLISSVVSMKTQLKTPSNYNNNLQNNSLYKPPISKPVRTTYIGNILLKENNNKNYNMLVANGQTYSKQSLDDLLKMTENFALNGSFKKSTPSPIGETKRGGIPVPSPRNSLKNMRPSLASSTTSLSSLNHSITSSTSSLSDNSMKSATRLSQQYLHN